MNVKELRYLLDKCTEEAEIVFKKHSGDSDYDASIRVEINDVMESVKNNIVIIELVE